MPSAWSGEPEDPRGTSPTRAARRRSARAPASCSPCCTSSSTRGTRQLRDAAARRLCAEAIRLAGSWSRSCPTSRALGPTRAHAPDRVALPPPVRRPAPSSCCWRTRTGRQWDRDLIAEGPSIVCALVPCAATNPARTSSRPRSTRCTATRPATSVATNWGQILQLYDQLMTWRGAGADRGTAPGRRPGRGARSGEGARGGRGPGARSHTTYSTTRSGPTSSAAWAASGKPGVAYRERLGTGRKRG